MNRARHLLVGGLCACAVALGAAWLSARPAIRTLSPDTAVIRLAISHAGARRCRTRTEAELAALPRNMQRAEVCERRRQPVRFEMDIDGAPVIAELLPPGGIAGDAASRLYRRLPVPAGRHRIVLRLRDTDRAKGFDHVAEREVDLAPARNLAIDFSAETGFRLR